MTYLRTVLRTSILAALLMSTAVQAQDTQSTPLVCAPRYSIVQSLRGKYDEAQLGMGLLNSRTILELWVSKATGTWTILKTNPEGWTCIIASGIGWRAVIPDYSTPTTATP